MDNSDYSKQTGRHLANPPATPSPQPHPTNIRNSRPGIPPINNQQALRTNVAPHNALQGNATNMRHSLGSTPGVPPKAATSSPHLSNAPLPTIATNTLPLKPPSQSQPSQPQPQQTQPQPQSSQPQPQQTQPQPQSSQPQSATPSKSGELTQDPDITDIPAASLPVGMKIDGRYEILGVLGVGGFATVYRAHHLTIDRDVALKVMDLKKGVDPSYSERFFREAKIAAKIHHNNVVSIYDFGHVTETNQPYIAMEMLHGHDLSHELQKSGPLSPQRAFVLFRPVLDALYEGHRLGIVHKDLKPENLYLVDPGGQRELMKVLDFGVARINSGEVAKLTSAGQLLGTPRYLAPEYIKTQNVTPAIDVYQMALILSEALTGVPAVSGDPFHAMMLHCSGQLTIADFLLEGPVGDVFRKAIAIDPNERYANCEEFGKALDSVANYFSNTSPLEGGSPQLTPDSRTSSKMTAMPLSSNGTTGAFTTLNPNPPAAADTPQPAQSKSVLKIVVILLLILIILFAAAAFYYLKIYRPEQERIRADARAAAANSVKKEDPKLNFSFSSDPLGADVIRNNIKLCTTPCHYEFKQSELRAEFRPFLVFKRDGFEEQTREITEELFKSSNGNINVVLNKLSAKDLPFKFEYTPQNARVVDANTGDVVCKLSPCTYVFNVDKTAVTLTFSAVGYLDKNVPITQADFTEDPIVVALEKRPVVQRKKQVEEPKNETKTAAPPPPAPEKKTPPPKKEEKKQVKTLF